MDRLDEALNRCQAALYSLHLRLGQQNTEQGRQEQEKASLEAEVLSTEKQEQAPTVEEQVLNVLLARNAVQAIVEEDSPPQLSGATLMTLGELDCQLRGLTNNISNYGIDLRSWRKTLSIPETWWWWFPQPQKQYPKIFDQDWLWTGAIATCLTISAGLILNTAARFGLGSASAGGAIAIAAQTVVTLLTTKSALTESGRAGLKRFLERREIPEHYWHELGALGAFVALLFVAGIHQSLPLMATRYDRIGYEHYENNQLDSALADYQLALALRPDDAQVHYRLGLVYEDLQKLDDAKAEYQRVVEQDADAVNLETWLKANNNLARLHILDERYQQAIPLLLQAKQAIDPNTVSADQEMADTYYAVLKNLGWARLGTNRLAEAEAELQAAIAVDATKAPAHCLLAQLYQQQEQLAETTEAWGTCLSLANALNPDEDNWIGLANQWFASQEASE